MDWVRQQKGKNVRLGRGKKRKRTWKYFSSVSRGHMITAIFFSISETTRSIFERNRGGMMVLKASRFSD